jgi:hypothetical protein
MILTFILTLTIVVLCVGIHYEFLYRLSGYVSAHGLPPRIEVVVGVVLALSAHVIEIWIFAVGYYVALQLPELGAFTGERPVQDIWDCGYLSFVVYSTLGFGDIVPTGWIRFMVGVEAMLGLVQIAWTASYLFMQMEMNWGLRSSRPGAGSRRIGPDGPGR